MYMKSEKFYMDIFLIIEKLFLRLLQLGFHCPLLTPWGHQAVKPWLQSAVISLRYEVIGYESKE